LFFLIAVLIVGVIALFLGDFWIRARSYPITAYFQNVQGLVSGAEVRMAGVKIGRVTAVTLAPNPRFPRQPAAVRMAIYREVLIYDNDAFLIQQGALLGEKYVDVQRGGGKPKSRVAAGGQVSGGAAGGIEDLTEEARALVREARGALASIQGVFATEFNSQAIRLILTNVVAATAKADQMAAQGIRLAAYLTAEAQRAGPDLTRLATNLARASESVRSTADLVRQTLATSTMPRDANITVENLRSISQDLSAITDSFAQVLATPETREKMQGALDNMHQATANLAQITGSAEKLLGDEATQADLKQALARLRETADHIAHITAEYDQVLTDPRFKNDLTGTVTAARQAAEAGTRTLSKAEASLEQADRAIGSLSRLGRAVVPERVDARVDLETTGRQEPRVNTDVDIHYSKRPNSFWRVGVRNVGDRGRANVQRAFPLGDDRVRVGLIAGEPGVGYDIDLSPRLSLEADLWDPSNVQFDLRGSYKLAPRVDMLFGFTDMADRPDALVGVRYRTGP
jgi:ABC-type transporter Mla subunit MlaD